MNKPKIRVGLMRMNTGTRVHRDTEYNRRKMKQETLMNVEEGVDTSGLYPLVKFIQDDLGMKFQFHEEYGFYLIKLNNSFSVSYYDTLIQNPPQILENLVLVSNYNNLINETFSILNSNSPEIFYLTFNVKRTLKN
ncbi:MAG: hypothetical protein ISS82_00930 [Nanoarchaeota archaeon]|nr:hypothetical protein [Nanoarchaeota archaeon]